MAQLVSVWSNVVRACGQGNDVAPVQQESEQRAVALLSRNTVLEEELDNYKVCGLSAAVRLWCGWWVMALLCVQKYLKAQVKKYQKEISKLKKELAKYKKKG